MASKKTKKPKGILEDAAGAINNIVNSLNPKPMETQNLAEYKQTVKNVVTTGATAADLYTTGGVGKSFMQNIVAPGAKVASPKTKSKAESAGLKQFAKDAAVSGATVGGSYAVGKTVGKIVSNSSTVNKLVNTVTKQQVVVHGSPTQGIKTINPTKGINRGKGTRGTDLGKQVFVEIPTKNPQLGPSVAKNYALGDMEINAAKGQVGSGSIYIGKTKKSNLVFDSPKVARTSKPVKVVSEIKLSDIQSSNPYVLNEKYAQALKKAGGPTIPKSIRKQLKGPRKK